jgi:hypothetical protein
MTETKQAESKTKKSWSSDRFVLFDGWFLSCNNILSCGDHVYEIRLNVRQMS